MRMLLTLTWLEIKIFVREPLGVVGTVGFPVAIFLLGSRFAGPSLLRAAQRPGAEGLAAILPVFASIWMALSAVVSLVTIISIYREGGILKRLRATPLSPIVILSAHVIVKILFTVLTLVLMILVGRRYIPPDAHVQVLSYAAALVVSTWSILSIGFVLASLVPTARFAQPIAVVILYPMIAVSGLFFPVSALPTPVLLLAKVTPLFYAVSLLDGIWRGEGWCMHLGDVTALAVLFAVFTAISSRVFRWE